MKLNELHDNPGARKPRTRVGRGIGSGKGKTGGRGVKGQTSRTGVSINGFEGGQMPLHRRLPKRGFTNIFRTEYTVLNLDRLAELNEAELTLDAFVAKGFLKRRGELLKILGNGELNVALTVHALKFSKTAQQKIEKAGGKAILVG